jgi:glycosyltransferase involved in cell wall biosynthesis
MKIAHLTSTFPPYHGGTGSVAYHNAVGIARLGHDVTVITSQFPLSEHEYPREISVQRLPSMFRVGNAPFLPKLFQLNGFDLVHIHYPFIFGQEIIFLKSFLKTRYLITYHQDLILSGFVDRIVKLHHQVVGKSILARAQRLLTTSLDYACASRIAPLFDNIGRKIEELPNGVDINTFHPLVHTNGLREAHNIAPDELVLMFVGGLDTPHYFKGIETLLYSLVKLNDDAVKLIVIGDGDLRDSYERLACSLDIAGRIIFRGHVSDELLPRYYALCDLLILPSVTMGEAFGMVLLEAMASGKPVVASNLPGVRSVVQDGYDGFLCSPGDVDHLTQTIRQVLDLDTQTRENMGRCGRKKVETKYSWEIIVKQLEGIYEQILSEISDNAGD